MIDCDLVVDCDELVLGWGTFEYRSNILSCLEFEWEWSVSRGFTRMVEL